jgi:SAM-dependent methyltransferase
MDSLRWFHNRVKEQLLNEALARVRAGNDLSVLDLACGAMGDIGKLARGRRIKKVVGIDADEAALHEAHRRSLPHSRAMQIEIMQAMDCRNFDAVSACLAGEKFDIILCCFAVQYLVPHDGLMQFVARHLRDSSSSFIGTVMNGDKVASKLRDGSDSNSLIHIRSSGGGSLDVSMKHKTRFYHGPGVFISEPAFCPESLIIAALSNGLTLGSWRSFRDHTFPSSYTADPCDTSSLYDSFAMHLR